MSRKVLLVGHCGPDSSYLRMAVKAAAKDVTILSVDDAQEMQNALGSVDLVLFNRELGYGFEPDTGVEMIRSLKASHPNLRMMLITNYPDVQTEAIRAGALPGFGKREIGSPRVAKLLQEALAGQHAS